MKYITLWLCGRKWDRNLSYQRYMHTPTHTCLHKCRWISTNRRANEEKEWIFNEHVRGITRMNVLICGDYKVEIPFKSLNIWWLNAKIPFARSNCKCALILLHFFWIVYLIATKLEIFCNKTIRFVLIKLKAYLSFIRAHIEKEIFKW